MDTAHPRPGQRLQCAPLEIHPDEMQRAHGVPHSRGHPDTLDGPGCSGAPCCCSRVGSSWGPYKNHPEVGVQHNREKLTENESDGEEPFFGNRDTPAGVCLCGSLGVPGVSAAGGSPRGRAVLPTRSGPSLYRLQPDFPLRTEKMGFCAPGLLRNFSGEMQTEVDKLNEQSPQKARLKVSNISAVKGRKASADGSSWRPFLDPASAHTRGTEPPLTPLRPACWERGSQPLCPSNKEPGKPRDGGGVPPPPPERRSAGGRVLTSPLGPVSPVTAPGFPCEQSAPLICSGQAQRRQGQLGGLLPGLRSTLGPRS
ncbi:hypothetical protein MJG53_009183 [Ovis ammon polii x Ovis aries]|uniref:Uncharacterized protein n=1 Tax=Ovis ammon polii x Ovis aries TaxID=2918886 RepID=A0ACB9UYE3_9CETA|nr:hypothetical protein MJG53_009183 [Ovis ammon polii x Ovis aries]